MRILAIADEEARYYYDYYTPGKLDEIDLILACGDLKREYLEFLITMGRCPVLYVRGNHDDSFAERPPEGCICIEDQIYVYQGVRILGLGGSHKYRDGENMYTERQMRWRVAKLWFQLRRYKGFDILLTHAPARNLNDFDSMSHRGFQCFGELLEKYEPKYFIHGHIHKNYGYKIPRLTKHGKTTVINAWEYYKFDY
jgi:Icc-related predicted phosphoesterase